MIGGLLLQSASMSLIESFQQVIEALRGIADPTLTLNLPPVESVSSIVLAATAFPIEVGVLLVVFGMGMGGYKGESPGVPMMLSGVVIVIISVLCVVHLPDETPATPRDFLGAKTVGCYTGQTPDELDPSEAAQVLDGCLNLEKFVPADEDYPDDKEKCETAAVDASSRELAEALIVDSRREDNETPATDRALRSIVKGCADRN